MLAKWIINGLSPAPKVGMSKGWTFLIPTPKLIEKALFNILLENFGLRVTKQGKRIENTRWTLNPDIGFDNGSYIGDVKYKVNSDIWIRSDLYEIVTFAEGFQATRAFMIDLMNSLPRLKIGEINVENIRWRAVESIPPALAYKVFLGDMKKFLI
jgi:hypothetical protein